MGCAEGLRSSSWHVDLELRKEEKRRSGLEATGAGWVGGWGLPAPTVPESLVGEKHSLCRAGGPAGTEEMVWRKLQRRCSPLAELLTPPPQEGGGQRREQEYKKCSVSRALLGTVLTCYQTMGPCELPTDLCGACERQPSFTYVLRESQGLSGSQPGHHLSTHYQSSVL